MCKISWLHLDHEIFAFEYRKYFDFDKNGFKNACALMFPLTPLYKVYKQNWNWQLWDKLRDHFYEWWSYQKTSFPGIFSIIWCNCEVGGDNVVILSGQKHKQKHFATYTKKKNIFCVTKIIFSTRNEHLVTCITDTCGKKII